MLTLRWLVSLVLAAGITLGLFFFMQALVATGSLLDQRRDVFRIVDATMPEILLEEILNIDPPEPMEERHDMPELPEPETQFGNGTLPVDRQPPDVEPILDFGRGIDIPDGDMLPLVHVQPTYPTRAAQQGQEGWVQVRFIVTAAGGVRDIEVVDAEPPRVFDSAAVRAAERFRFQPRVVDGEAVDVPGVQYVFRFQLEN